MSTGGIDASSNAGREHALESVADLLRDWPDGLVARQPERRHRIHRRDDARVRRVGRVDDDVAGQQQTDVAFDAQRLVGEGCTRRG